MNIDLITNSEQPRPELIYDMQINDLDHNESTVYFLKSTFGPYKSDCDHSLVSNIFEIDFVIDLSKDIQTERIINSPADTQNHILKH